MSVPLSSQPERVVWGGARVVHGNRSLVGVRFGWWKDRRCRKLGHPVDTGNGVRVMSGAVWPICTRCGRGVEERDYA